VAKRGEGRIVDGEWWPSGFRKQNGGYYSIERQTWTHLGREYGRSLAEYYRRRSVTGSKPVFVADLITRFIEDRRRKRRKTHTLRDYEKWGQRVIAAFGHMFCDSLTVDHLRDYADARLDNSGGIRQLRGEIGLIRSSYRWARDRRKWLNVSPADELEEGDLPELPHRTRVPNCWDLETFWCHASRHIQAYIPLKLALSTRQEDLLAIHVDQIGDTHLTLPIQKSRVHRLQLVRITPGLRELLDYALELPRENGWLFERRTGEPYVDLLQDGYVVSEAWSSMWQRSKQAVRRAVGDAFVPFIDADMRAVAARAAYEAGGIERVRAVLAHSDHVTPGRYLRDRLGIEVEPLV